MKLSFTIILFLLATVANAQTDWWCVQPTAKNYYLNDFYYLRGMRIDSVKTIGSNTVLYPFKTARGYYMSNQKLKPSGSWLGDTIIIAPDGTHYFDNFWGDTVIIKTQASLNDSWELYNDATSQHYTATVTSVTTATVLGVQDDTKEITLTSWDGAGINGSDPLHNTKIVLSKNHGLVRVPDLFMFPMHEPNREYQRGFDYWMDRDIPSLTIPTASQFYFELISFQNPDVLKIYDFNVGDVLEYKADGLENQTSSGVEKTIVDEIVEKNATATSIQYKIGRWTHTKNYKTNPTKYTTVPSFVNVTYNTALLLDANYMPEEWGQKDILRYNPADTSFCETGPWYERLAINMQADSSINTQHVCGSGYRYKQRLGRTWYNLCWTDDFGGQYLNQLVHTRKNGIPCHLYHELGIEPAAQKNEIAVYPNPASDRLFLNLPSPGAATVTMFNTMGQQVKEMQTKERSLSIDVSELPAGLYHISILQSGKTINRKVQIER